MSRPLRVVAWPLKSNRVDQPYNWLLSEGLARAGANTSEFSPRRVIQRPDVWHIHWPDAIFNDPIRWRVLKNMLGLIGLLEIAHARGTAIVWTAHNLRSHDRRYPRLEAAFWRLLIRRIDGWISLSESGHAAALDQFGGLRSKPSAVVPIGHYRGVYDDKVSRSEARQRLKLPDGSRVVLFIGQVRPYKGVERLVDCFRELPGDDLRLVVAGRPSSEELAESIRSRSSEDSRIVLDLSFVPADEIQVYLRAADLVALPFLAILNSASAMLALSFDRPVLVPALGSMGELQQVVGPDWVRLYDDQLTSADLGLAIEWATHGDRTLPPLDAFDWDSIGHQTLDAYERTRADVDRGRR